MVKLKFECRETLKERVVDLSVNFSFIDPNVSFFETMGKKGFDVYILKETNARCDCCELQNSAYMKCLHPTIKEDWVKL